MGDDSTCAPVEASQVNSLSEIEDKLRDFRRAREWAQFHTPKNLAISVAIEAGELLEHFQWRSEAEIEEYLRTDRQGVAEELADVAIYLIQLAEVAGIGLLDAIQAKIAENAVRYPVEIARGNSQKQPNHRHVAANNGSVAKTDQRQRGIASNGSRVRRA